jgi:hypothetical protein
MQAILIFIRPSYNNFYKPAFAERKMGNKVERQIRWDVRSQGSPETHEYLFLVINQGREIERIIQRASENLRPADEPEEIDEQRIKGSGLRYKLVRITSYQVPPYGVDWSRIYRGVVERDRNLASIQSSDNLREYVARGIARGSFR